MKKILHTEASKGWGGQEMRILKESIAMRALGHEVFLAVNEGGILAEKASQEGFKTYTFPMSIKRAPLVIYQLIKIIRKHSIDVINTHSSIDSWLGGISGKFTRCLVVRTRHISAPIKPGLNSKLLYKTLADFTVTTCEEIAEVIRNQAHIGTDRCKSIPTGIDPTHIKTSPKAIQAFKDQYQIKPTDILAGTACVLRSWKGIEDLLQAAHLLRNEPNLKWIIIGSGPGDAHYQKLAKEMDLQGKVIFTGFIESPFSAISALDIFLLLSTANEGVSQASLQAAYLKKPLITTPTGGLREVCINEKNGYSVPIHSPNTVAEKVKFLLENPPLRQKMGLQSHKNVNSNFLFSKTSSDMNAIFTTKK